MGIYILFIVLLLDIILFLVGGLWTRRMQEYKDSILMSVVCGLVTFFLVFQLMAVPAIFMGIKLSMVTICWVIIVGGLAVYSLILNRRQIVEKIKSLKAFFRFKKEYGWLYLAVLLVIGQIAMIALTYVPHEDDNRYIVIAVDAYESDEMLTYHPFTGEYLGEPKSELIKDTVAPINMFWAMLAKIFSVHPAIFMHTLVPLFLLPICYGLYLLIARKLVGTDYRKQGIFLCILTMFNFVNHVTPIEGIGRLSHFIWWGKSILVLFFVPLTILILVHIMEEKKYYIGLMLSLISSCLVTIMAPVFLPLIVGCYALVDGFATRKMSRFWKLIACCVPALCYAVLYFVTRQA